MVDATSASAGSAASCVLNGGPGDVGDALAFDAPPHLDAVRWGDWVAEVRATRGRDRGSREFWRYNPAVTDALAG